MAIREVFLYPPLVSPFDSSTWAEAVVAEILRPVHEQHETTMPDWYWFSRYVEPRNEGNAGVPATFDLVIPEQHAHFLRHLKLRYEVDDAIAEPYESALRAAAGNCNCHCGFADYDLVRDLGGDRFAGDPCRQPDRRSRRARLVAIYLMSVCELVMDALTRDGEHWRLEPNSGQLNNPFQSSFDSLLHMFCNITDTPAAIVPAAVPGSNEIRLVGWVYSGAGSGPLAVRL